MPPNPLQICNNNYRRAEQQRVIRRNTAWLMNTGDGCQYLLERTRSGYLASVVPNGKWQLSNIWFVTDRGDVGRLQSGEPVPEAWPASLLYSLTDARPMPKPGTIYGYQDRPVELVTQPVRALFMFVECQRPHFGLMVQTFVLQGDDNPSRIPLITQRPGYSGVQLGLWHSEMGGGRLRPFNDEVIAARKPPVLVGGTANPSHIVVPDGSWTGMQGPAVYRSLTARSDLRSTDARGPKLRSLLVG